MKYYDKVLFVCKSNTTMSPMAEAILQKKMLLEDILVESRGLVVLFPEPVNPKAEAILRSNSLTMSEHMSVPFVQDDFDERTLVLAMDQDTKAAILRDYSKVQNLYTLGEFIRWEGEAPDPYGGALADYGNCYERLNEMLTALTAILRQEENE